MKALLIALFLPLLAHAQSLTLDSPCGAPGVGIRTADRKVIEEKVGRPGWHVDADGGWTTCQPPPTPPGCQVEQVQHWTVGEHSCRAETVYTWLAHDTRRTVATPVIGAQQGYATLECLAGRTSISVRACAPRTRCNAPPPGYEGRSDDPGQPSVIYRWTGTLAVGESAMARSDDGRLRPVACEPAGLRLLVATAPLPTPVPAPAAVSCLPAVTFRGPTLYRYDGPPVAPGQSGTFTSAAGRTVEIPCGPAGRWQ